MEIEYEKYVHHICALVLKKKYHRAIKITEHLLTQGIQTAQIYLILSYAYRMVHGPQSALKILEQKCQLDTPLVQLGKAQYLGEIGDYSEATTHLKGIQELESKDKKSDGEGCSVVDVLANNYGVASGEKSLLTAKQAQMPENYQLQYVYSNDDRKIVSRMNCITEKFEELQREEQAGKTARYKAIFEDYKALSDEFSSKKRKNSKLLDILEKFMKYLKYRLFLQSQIE